MRNLEARYNSEAEAIKKANEPEAERSLDALAMQMHTKLNLEMDESKPFHDAQDHQTKNRMKWNEVTKKEFNYMNKQHVWRL